MIAEQCRGRVRRFLFGPHDDMQVHARIWQFRLQERRRPSRCVRESTALCSVLDLSDASLDQPTTCGSEPGTNPSLDVIDRSLHIRRSLGVEDAAGPSTQVVDRGGFDSSHNDGRSCHLRGVESSRVGKKRGWRSCWGGICDFPHRPAPGIERGLVCVGPPEALLPEALVRIRCASDRPGETCEVVHRVDAFLEVDM